MGNNPTESGEVKKNILEAGEKRYDAIAESLKKGKEKVSKWWSSAKSSVGGFFKRAAVVGLATPELTGKAWGVSRDATLDTIAAADEKLHQGIDKAGNAMAAGAQYVKEQAKQGWEAFGKFSDRTGAMFGRWEDGIEKWTKTKVEQGKDIVATGTVLTVMVGAFAIEKTKEGFQKVGEGIKNQYEKVIDYGEKAIAAAEYKKQQIMDGFRAKWNQAKMAMLEARARKLEADAVAHAEAAESHMEAAREAMQKADALRSKMTLLGKLSVVGQGAAQEAAAAA